MAVIYLDHPKHGSKVACMEDEAKADEAKGWVRRKVAALLQPAASVSGLSDLVHRGPVPNAEPIPNASNEPEIMLLRQRWQAKFGSKPHHKKSAATLRAELEA